MHAMNTKFFLWIVLSLIRLTVQAQDKDTVQADLSYAKKELIPLLEARMQQPGGDTASHYLLQKIAAHCGGDYDCSRRDRNEVLSWLWHKGWFKIGIPLTIEEVRLADLYGTMENRIAAYERLTIFYWWVGDNQQFYLSMEKKQALYEEANMPHKAIETEVAILDGKAWYLDEMGGLLPELNKLLERAIEIGNEMTIMEVRSKIMHIAEGHGMYDLLEEHLSEMEKYPFSDPLTQEESSHAYFAANRRGILLKVDKKYDEAKRYFNKALGIVKHWDHPYHATATFRHLAKLEWEREDVPLAKTYLDTAFVYADSLTRHDELSKIYEIKAEIAEKEKQFEDALLFNKKMHLHQETYDSTSVGFDAKSYYLQLEKDQLAAEKETQELALQLRSNQLNFSIAIVALVVLAAIGLFIGFRNQRRRKEELAAQNALIQRQAEQLKALDAAKSRFFANVSHELRTPISLIRGPIHSVLKKKHLDEEDAQLLQLADQGSKNLQLLVNEILDLGKMESGRMELVQTPVRLAAYFTHYLSQFESLAYQKGVHYGFEVFLSKNTAANLDKEKCRQLVYNLLSNAFKFTQTGGAVNVAVKMEGGQLYLEVSDTGKGIHPNDLPHVFDRYFQTNRPDAPATGGTGIGLALCQEYARLFEGQISVASEWGKGTVFKVAFPVEEVKGDILEEDLSNELISTFKEVKEKPDQFQAAPTAPPANGKKPTILVVEDNKELQSYMQLVLKKHFNVALAGNGHEALTHLAENDHPDLIISDLMMPIMDGYQLLERLKGEAATQHIPVIMLTARAEKDDRLKALRIGVDDYLTKPFDEEELIARITNLLSNKAARTEASAEEERENDPVSIGLSRQDKEWLDAFETYLRSHLSNNYLSVADMADEFAMSTSTLLRQTKRLTGLTPQQYLLEMRLDMARQLLEDRRYRSVSRVALEVGYGDVRNFSKSYKKRFGKSPSELIVE